MSPISSMLIFMLTPCSALVPLVPRLVVLSIGEETLAELGEGNVELTQAPTWIVDPIDGTLNFCHSQ